MKDLIRVLIIDDDEDDYIITRDLLSEVKEIQYQLDWVQTFEDGLNAIKKDLHQVYLIDYRLGEKDGLELIKNVITEGFRRPFIILTGQGNRELDFQAMEIGASDYLVKNQLDAETLERSIRYSLRSNQAEIEKITLEKRLSQAQKMESIGNLAGGIAHDFNNILASIIGFTELALDDVDKDSIIEDNLQEVYAAGKRAKDLVRQILAFARQSDEELKPVQVDTIINEVLRFIRSSIPATIEIKQNVDSDSLIIGSQMQVHQIMMNLCTNAAHAMEDEGGILNVSLKDIVIDKDFETKNMDLAYGNYLKISVSDTGTGIAPGIIDSIFDPYFTTKKPGEGTGMGLAMVLGIVKSYGGIISVDSTLGKGTTFTIYLPVTRKRKVERLYEIEKLPSGTEQILFLDDEAPIAKMGSQGLERLGYKVTTRTNSVEALELFRSKPGHFDLVITDMTMPNLTGDKLVVELMKIRRDIPIILCTGYSNKISDETASDIGIKAFAYKPVVKAELAKTVRKVLDEAKRIEK